MIPETVSLEKVKFFFFFFGVTVLGVSVDSWLNALLLVSCIFGRRRAEKALTLQVQAKERGRGGTHI